MDSSKDTSLSSVSLSDNSSLIGGSDNKRSPIQVNELTGKKGLMRVMDFIDKDSPPVKGSFKYKDSTLEKYGRIFSRDEIGKYSSKIENICNSILSKDGKIAEGIIMIYSEYIDGGVLPVALALEEMGFSRYGDNISSFFETPPSDKIDSRTLKPRIKSQKDFIPARYAMITGDSRISPNNNFELKALTNDDNINGDIIKVVLITKAGSEGLDYKVLRQIHIMEPWYNMSRIEQIIGRGVRNLSHKDLPFEKRNVEIFMYGTILENNSEESADLYVYRSAEKKVINIGNVSRILKETAVDCILNHDQVNFSEENMAKFIDNKVEIVLSNGDKIDYKVGDIPFSATCDYMKSCNYKCYPDKEITEEMVRDDSYSQSFIMLNSEKIFKKIRMLMKERFFYKKETLIKMINHPKPYPLVQIYAALTQLIEDKNEFIVDKYGRTGYLINIDEYYLFQPSELNNRDNISIFNRSVPIDYKHQMIEIDIKQDITRPVLKLHSTSEHEKNKKTETERAENEKATGNIRIKERDREREDNISELPKLQENDIFKNIEENYNLTIQYLDTDEKIVRGDDNWYKYCGITIKRLIKEKIIERKELLVFLLDHILDLLLFDEKLKLLNYIYSLNIIENGSLTDSIKTYFDNKIIIMNKLRGILLYLNNKINIVILKNSKWVKADPEDEVDIKKGIVIKYKKRPLSKIIGFIDDIEKKNYLDFKIKEIDSEIKKKPGFKCNDSSKPKKLILLNEIFGYEKYTKDNSKGMVQQELCSMLEFLLRHNDKIKKNDKMWFADYEMAKLFNI